MLGLHKTFSKHEKIVEEIGYVKDRGIHLEAEQAAFKSTWPPLQLCKKNTSSMCFVWGALNIFECLCLSEAN